jgi:hypothetical protein
LQRSFCDLEYAAKKKLMRGEAIAAQGDAGYQGVERCEKKPRRKSR